MSADPPRFELARVFEDGSSELEIVPVSALERERGASRRDFFGASIAVGAALGTSACGSASKAVLPADLACGRIRAHTARIFGLAVSRDGSTLVSAGGDGKAKSWALPSLALRQTMSAQPSIASVAVGADAKVLVCGGSENTVGVWSLPEATRQRVLSGPAAAVTGVALVDADRTVLASSRDGSVRNWRLVDGQESGRWVAHAKGVERLAVSADGSLVATSGDSPDDGIRLWRRATATLVTTLTGHDALVTALAFGPDGDWLASGDRDRGVRLWNVGTGETRPRTISTEGVDSLVFSMMGGLLIGGSKSGIFIWRMPGGELHRRLPGHGDRVTALAVAHDDARFWSAGAGTIKTWSLPDGAPADCLVDLRATPAEGRGASHRYTTASGQVVTYTLPCGSPIPAGATCTCNCVPGNWSLPSPPQTSPSPTRSGGSYCSCNLVCTCNRVCTCVPVCQAHKLLDHDPVVAGMARDILLSMGRRERRYMAWAAGTAESAELAAAIRGLMRYIDSAPSAGPSSWPTIAQCVARLDHPDPVIALMAAQMLQLHVCRNGFMPAAALGRTLARRLAQAPAMHWKRHARGASSP